MKSLHVSKSFVLFAGATILLAIVMFLFLSHLHKDSRIILPGYVDGKFIYVSANFSGTLQKLHVMRGDNVQFNQDLFTLDAMPEKADLEVAKANIEQINHQVTKNESNFMYLYAQMKRKQALHQKNLIAKDEFEIANSAYLQALADKNASLSLLNARKAELNKANWAIEQKTVKSPLFSIVYDTYYSEGEIVNAGTPILALLSPKKVRVVFFVPERLLSKMKFKDQVEVTCDNCQHPIKATINFISTNAEFTPPVIYSQEERTKLVYRIEAIPQAQNILQPLHPGQPVSVILTDDVNK